MGEGEEEGCGRGRRDRKELGWPSFVKPALRTKRTTLNVIPIHAEITYDV